MEISINLIQDTIWQLRKGSSQHAEKQRNFLLYDGSPCSIEVRAHLQALEMVRDQMLADTLCICPQEVAAIYYGAKKYLGHECQDPVPDYIKTDRPDKARWVLENPECVLYEHWVDYVKAQCQRIGLNLDVKVKECASIGLDIKVAYEQACGEILLDFTVEEIKCDFGIDITVEEVKNCKVDYDFYVKPLNCDISLAAYVKLLSCGVSVDTIVKQVNCGATLDMIVKNVDACLTEEEVIPEVTPPPVLASMTCPVLPAPCEAYNCGDPIDLFIRDEGQVGDPIIGINPLFFPVIVHGDCPLDIEGNEIPTGTVLPAEWFEVVNGPFIYGNYIALSTPHSDSGYVLELIWGEDAGLGSSIPCVGSPMGGFLSPYKYTLTDSCGRVTECTFYWVSGQC